jgi:tungstate transport system substrate-binding protein
VTYLDLLKPFITVASTTSTEDSGLFGYLLPVFTKDTDAQVWVVAIGTGQALKIGERGDSDVAFVHDRRAELALCRTWLRYRPPRGHV